MTINSLPAVLQPAIQTNYLAHTFEEALTSNFKFRSAAVRERFPNGVGETVTRTRAGLLLPVSATIQGSANTNLDNGLTPASYGVEQYTATLALLASTLDLNLQTSAVAIVSYFVENAKKLAVQAAQSLDRQAQAALYAAGFYGNTRVNTTSTTTAVKLDDIRGFQNVWVNGVLTPVSPTNTLAITLNGNPYTITAAVADGTNVSSVAAFGGISGTVTTTVAAAAGDASVTSGVGTPAVCAFASTVIRPNNRSNTSALVAGDVLTLGNCLDATAQLRSNAVEGIENDTYVIFLSPTSMRQIFKDPDFKQLYQGDAEKSSVFPNAMIYKLAGLTFVQTTDVKPQVINGVTVQRPLIVGKGALLEMIADAMYIEPENGDDSVTYNFDGVRFVNRMPLDRLNSIVAQSWMSIFAYVAPTDTSVSPTCIPTASNSAYKRIVMIETTSV